MELANLKENLANNEAEIHEYKNELNRIQFYFEPLLARLPGYVFYKDSQSKYIWGNQNFAQLCNLTSREEVPGKNDFDFEWSRPLAKKLISCEQQVIESGNTLINCYELPIKNLDGHCIFLLIETTPFYDPIQKTTGTLSVAVDITNQKLTEQEVTTALNIMEDIFYNLPGLIYWKNKKSQYIGFNKNVVELSGLSRSQFRGKTDKELNWGQQEAESFQKDDQEIMKKGNVKVTEYEIPITRPDGRFMTVRTEKSPLYDRNGNITGVLGVAMDITDIKVLENEIRAEKEIVEKLSQAKTEFIRNMEHDIRTPFSGIYTIANALATKETDSEKKRYLSAIAQGAKELLDYCNNILDFSKIESGTLPILYKKFDLKKLVNGVIAIEKSASEVKELMLTVEYPEDLPKIIIGDNNRLVRVLINLVSNAIKFTQKGYVKIIVKSVKKEEKRAILRFIIQDTGIGISKNQLQYIYEKFSKLVPSNKGDRGYGLGLPTVKLGCPNPP